ncbi:hypothetical protein AB0I68_15690 [Streptomyces sp. NPDC050448]|uniref:GNAT family N-acetyltransferase n=1 Tax=Streptomyces sp. NPDC050448 TaxID=3155404 RepID=UPI0034347F1A
MTVSIRDLRPGDPWDAESVVRVRRAALPFMIATTDGVAFELSSAPAAKRHRLLVAETADGLVAGTAEAGLAYDSPEPGRSAMTGTRRAFRGRGLARLAKTDSPRRARAAGCTEAFTGNDTGNEPMLAINTSFGYEVCATETRYAKQLKGPDQS